MLAEAIDIIKVKAPEWRISLYERDHGKWEAVLARNFKNVTEKGPHEIRVAEADHPLKALVNVANKAAGVFVPITADDATIAQYEYSVETTSFNLHWRLGEK